MIDHSRRVQLADELLRRFAAALRGAQLYAPTHPLVGRATVALTETLGYVTGQQPSLTVGVVGGEFVVGDVPLPRASGTMSELLGRLERAGVERITFDRAVRHEDVAALVRALAGLEARAGDPGDVVRLPDIPHVQVGRIAIQQRVETAVADTTVIRRLYEDATRTAGELWDGTAADGRPDTRRARELVDGLAQAVSQNRSALLALTALKSYDNYTFTHMVNVSILTMAQARALGIGGVMLREFGLGGLMHDIGKVRTPADILRKPDKLTPHEFAIVKQHVVDGAVILRKTPEMPPIVPVVAFEHHLRLDGTGYPEHVRRRTLNLATQLCGIADVYDAMRSQRHYQEAFPTDRILAVLQRNDGLQFDQHLVRRFVQILGIYPVGNLVRLNTGEAAVVLRANVADPHRPYVRVVLDVEGRRLPRPYDVSLLDSDPDSQWPSSIVGPLDPAHYALDTLAVL